jgi:alpha-tubulin suppressor-like RCC1 family protein
LLYTSHKHKKNRWHKDKAKVKVPVPGGNPEMLAVHEEERLYNAMDSRIVRYRSYVLSVLRRLTCSAIFLVIFALSSVTAAMALSQGVMSASSPDPAVAAIGETGYPFLGYAYASAEQGDVISLLETVFLEDLVIDRGIDITLKGGYGSGFSDRTGQASVLDGTLTIANGSLKADGLILSSSPIRVLSIWGGARHSIVLKSDGTVWDWGMNWSGKLGDNTTSVFSDPPNYAGGSNDRFTPIQVHGQGNVGYLNSIVAIMGGESHNFALKSDGSVWAWGWNAMGQLGDETFTDSYTPVQVSGLNSVIALGGRAYHSLALRSDGTVWTWGWNGGGQLADGTTTNGNIPVQVGGLSGVLKVTGGYKHSLALMSDHTLRSWGTNTAGQLGNGYYNNSSVPVQVSILSNAIQMSAGWNHNVALKSDGTVWTWGENTNGELGNDSTTNSNVPIQVGGLSNMIAVSGGDFHSAALKSDGTVWTWGWNRDGQLGDGTNAERHTPVQVKGLSNIIAIAARDHHNLALKSDGTVWAWGWNINGQLGDGTTLDRNIPVQVIFP